MEDFQAYRGLLFSIAYRMLGSAAEAEDIVQDAYLRYRAAAIDEIRSLKSYLSAIVTRLCLDHLKSAQVAREQYIGPWLPEPIIANDANNVSLTPMQTTEQLESISIAFLALLECLTPQERAVWLLYEVFEYSYAEIAEIIDKSEANCRQLLHRAKDRIRERRPRFEPSKEARQRLTDSFVAACQNGDLAMLTEILAQDVTLWSDGGGKATAALRPIYGQNNVLRFLLGVISKAGDSLNINQEMVNCAPAILVWKGETLINVVTFEMADDRIYGMRLIVNPDKLKFITDQRSRKVKE